MKSIYERVRAEQATREKARKAVEYKAGEAQRRSNSARVAADVRKDNRLDALLSGRVEPRTLQEFLLIEEDSFDRGDMS